MKISNTVAKFQGLSAKQICRRLDKNETAIEKIVLLSANVLAVASLVIRCHDIQYNDTQHKGHINDTGHNGT
jgi:hypothetical protein